MITVFADNKEIPVNMVEFSDEALTFKLDQLPENPKYISVNVCPTTPVYRVLEELRLIAGCLFERKFTYNIPLYLNLPYLPYGRADRMFEKGNPVGLKMFLWGLEEIGGFDVINVCDVHNKSAVDSICDKYSLNLNIIEKPQLECFRQSIPHDFNTKYDIVLAPDKGAVMKSQTIAEYLNVPVFNCGKERDISTGKVIKSTLPDIDFTGKVVLIPDDLMDGGYTFIKLAEQLKTAGAKQVDLYVTHMIGAKGLDSLKGLIDNVYCYQTVGKYLNKQDITNFNLK
jgi:ribose-phosphate pyrophosphokinase